MEVGRTLSLAEREMKRDMGTSHKLMVKNPKICGSERRGLEIMT